MSGLSASLQATESFLTGAWRTSTSNHGVTLEGIGRCRLSSESRYNHFLDIFDRVPGRYEDAFLHEKLQIVSVSSLFHVQVARYRPYQCQLELRHYF